MAFSSGDYIAIAVGCITAIKWLVEGFFKKSGTDEEKVTALRLDFERDKAAGAERDINYAAALARIERSVNNVQAQIRMISTGSANKRLRITDEDS